jgi:hypothetical protein
VTVCNQPAYAHLPPSQIVPKLADQGEYLGSESSFYRVLKAHNQVHHRGSMQAPRAKQIPTTHIAEGLASRGIASIRVDFPGCGDSVESFAINNLTNMLADIKASRDYALSGPNIDRERVGIHGFSIADIDRHVQLPGLR